jgi:DNA topoisomerase-3
VTFQCRLTAASHFSLQILRFKPEKYWTIVVRVRCGVGSGGRGLALEWARGRVFENEVGAMLLRPVSEANVATVLSVVRKEKCRTRPTASPSLSPECCCRQGYISYPRTETSAYPANFDLKEVLQTLTKSPSWGREAKVCCLSDSHRGGVYLRGWVCTSDLVCW